MKNKINLLIICTLFLTSLFLVLPVLAQTVDNQEDQTATDSSDQEKIEAVREFFKEKVKGENNTQVGEKKGFFGEINSIDELNLTITTNNGKKKISIASDSAIIGQNGQKIKSEDLEKDDFIVAMGYIDENLDLEVKRLVVDQQPEKSEKQVVNGLITDISAEEEIFTVKNEKNNIIYTIMIDNNTDLQRQDSQKVKFEDFQIGEYLVAIGTTSKNEEKIINATSVFTTQVVESTEVGEQ